jgi:hypothetical protein
MNEKAGTGVKKGFILSQLLFKFYSESLTEEVPERFEGLKKERK